jgi:hypothetical protein
LWPSASKGNVRFDDLATPGLDIVGVMGPQISTWCWKYAHAAFRDQGLVLPLVRISVGVPHQYWSPDQASVPPYVRELAPVGKLFDIKLRSDFEPRYRKRLDRFGSDRIIGRLEDVARQMQVDALVLCCFEDVSAIGQWCHREIAAAWLADHGIECVGEIPPAGGALAKRLAV